MATKRYTGQMLATEVITVMVGLLFLSPFYFLFVNSVKPFGEIMSDSASWPKAVQWDNFTRAWELTKFPQAFTNSFLITVVSVSLMALISAMGAYRMVRANTRLNRVLFFMFIASMIIPFQSIMMPLLRIVNELGLNGSRFGLIFTYLGLGASMTLFLFHGFVKSIPAEIEEAAVVDGCTGISVFFRIVLPMLQPMMMTVIVLNCLWVWNDYLLPSLILQTPELRTIPLATFAFFSQYTKQWDIALPALILGITPIIIFFLALQRYIVEGIAAGSVKG